MTDLMMESSLVRTYRYVRLGIAATVVVIVVAVGIAIPVVGLLPSISAYYYSPAQSSLVGALIAVSFGLFALSGRGVERNLLDGGALLAPIIALVPTPVYPGSVPGSTATCLSDSPCVPVEVRPAVDNGVATYLVVGAVVLGVALLIRRWQGLAWGQIAVSVIVTAVILFIVWVSWSLWRETFLDLAHFIASGLFFLIIAAVAVWNAFPHAGDPLWVRPSRALAIANIVIAVALVLDVLALAALLLGGRIPDGPIPPVFVCEFIAIGLFMVFWVLQSMQKWSDPNPSILGPIAVPT